MNLICEIMIVWWRVLLAWYSGPFGIHPLVLRERKRNLQHFEETIGLIWCVELFPHTSPQIEAFRSISEQSSKNSLDFILKWWSNTGFPSKVTFIIQIEWFELIGYKFPFIFHLLYTTKICGFDGTQDFPRLSKDRQNRPDGTANLWAGCRLTGTRQPQQGWIAVFG